MSKISQNYNIPYRVTGKVIGFYCNGFPVFEWQIEEDSGWDILIKNLDFDEILKSRLNIKDIKKLRCGDSVTLYGEVELFDLSVK